MTVARLGALFINPSSPKLSPLCKKQSVFDTSVPSSCLVTITEIERLNTVIYSLNRTDWRIYAGVDSVGYLIQIEQCSNNETGVLGAQSPFWGRIWNRSNFNSKRNRRITKLPRKISNFNLLSISCQFQPLHFAPSTSCYHLFHVKWVFRYGLIISKRYSDLLELMINSPSWWKH